MSRRLPIRLFLVMMLALTVSHPAGARLTAGPTYAARSASPLAPTDTPEVFASGSIYDAVLQGTMLYWSAYPGCPGEIPELCVIGGKPAGGGSQANLYQSPAAPFIRSNIAADAAALYWINTSHQIVRLSRGAMPGAAPAILASKENNLAASEIAVDANFIYWTESIDLSGTASDYGKLFRMPKAGGSRQLMQQYATPMKQLKADGGGGVFYLASPLFTDAIVRTAETAPGVFASDVSASTQVKSYAFNATTVFWADTFSGYRIRSAPRSDMTAVTVRHTLDSAGSPIVRDMAVDGANLYWHEYRSPTGGAIFRQPLAGGAPAPLTDNLLAATDLVSNGRHLFWINMDQLYRLSTAATPITLDLVANETPMEIIQAIQSPANDVPLVSGKETFVRVYARIGSSSAGHTSLSPAPLIALSGSRGGVELPGSPLAPLSAQPLGTASSRSSLASSYLFRLPASWTDGSVTLNATVNPRHALTEGDYANNTASRTATFARRAPMCLDIVPVATARGTSIAAWQPDGSLQPFFTRASTLLPASELRTFWRGGPPLRKPRWYLLDSDPFTVSRAAPDAEWLIFWMNARYLFSDEPAGCRAAGARTTRVAMLPDFPGREVNGMAAAWAALFFAFTAAPGPQNAPGGGVTLAHELDHIYGRGHVNCPAGVQSGIDPGYPYPTCQLDDLDASSHIGFDPLTRQLVQPGGTGDVMSAAHLIPTQRWVSDYTWNAMFNQLPATGLRALGSAAPAGSNSLIVAGGIQGGAVFFDHSYQVTGALQAGTTERISQQTVASDHYELRAYDAGNALIASTPLRVIDLEDAAADLTPFMTRLDYGATPPARLEIVDLRTAQAAGSLNAGANPPTVRITSPAGGSQRGMLDLAWQGSDPDGDLLRYVVRYSPDDGATWIALESSTTASQLSVNLSEGLPGGAKARIQVLASDGLRTAVATSEVFSVETHAPQAAILDDQDRGLNAVSTAAAAQSELVALHGRGYDAEDGPLSGASLRWTVSGPVSSSGDGEQLTLVDLPPGRYAVTLTATDSEGRQASASTILVIAPKHVADGSQPALDGACDDSGYGADRDPIRLRYSQGGAAINAQVSVIRAGGALYACFSGLPIGASATEAVSLKIDLDASGGAAPQSDDLTFAVERNGRARSGRGNGSGEVFDELAQGVEAAVSQGDASWQAELRIDSARLGGWDKLVRLLAAHSAATPSAWPRGGAPAPATWGLAALGRLSQTLSFGPLADRRLAQAPVAIAASASSGLPVAFTSKTPAVCQAYGNYVTLIGPGRCEIRAGQDGNASYGAAFAEQAFMVRVATFVPLVVR